SLRARMMAVLSTAWVAPGLAGPAISAEVARLFGWRWVFLGLLPVVAIAGSIAVPALIRLGPPPASQAREHRLTDGLRTAAGATMLLAGLSLAAGSGAILAGIAGMVLVLQPAVPVAAGLAAWTVAGLGMGLAYAPLSLMMLQKALPGQEGQASASLNLADVLGTAIGIGVGGAAVAAAAGS